MGGDQDKIVRVSFELPDEQAWEFAQFLKRAGFSVYRKLAGCDEEAYLMLYASDALRKALAEVGYAPR
jgi:hypothetical protein